MWWYFSNVPFLALLDQQPGGAPRPVEPALLGPDAGRPFHTTEVRASWQEYLTPPWARLHALALLWSGGVGIGDKRDFFGLGGFFEQDVLRAIFLGRPQCCTFLRGYPANSLRRRSLPDRVGGVPRAGRPHRTRLRDLPGVLPDDVGRAFADAGNAYQGRFTASELKVDVGVGSQPRTSTCSTTWRRR
jgi:hypothetical protein